MVGRTAVSSGFIISCGARCHHPESLLLGRFQGGKVGDEVADFGFFENADHGGHGRHGLGNFFDLAAGIAFGFSVGEVFEGDLFGAFFGQGSRDDVVIVEGEGNGAVAGSNVGAGVDDGVDEIGAVVEAADILQVGSGDASFATFLAFVAAGALGGSVVVENGTALVDVSAVGRHGVCGEGIG